MSSLVFFHKDTNETSAIIMPFHAIDEATKAQSSGAGFPGRAARLGFVLNESSPRVCTFKKSFPHFFPSPLPTQGLVDVRELFCL